jgi:hypothetical protein
MAAADPCPTKGIGGHGWRGDQVWRNQIKEVAKGGTVNLAGPKSPFKGAIPTQDEAIDLISDAGGTIDRIEEPHLAPNPHTFPHINYTTADGKKGTIQITEVLSAKK